MKYDIARTTQFKKDVKLAQKRGKDLSKLKDVIDILASGNPLDKKFRDHELKGEYANKRECHIEPDWLLVYRIEGDKLLLYLLRTGSHSDLFD